MGGLIISATGHRLGPKLGGYDKSVFKDLVLLARHSLLISKPKKVISGMAIGWDQAVSFAAYDLSIPYIAAVPFQGQEAKWPEESQKLYRDLLSLAEHVEVVSPFYSSRNMQVRNEWMVDRADEMLALWDGTFGGTHNCIIYAEKKGVPIRNVWSAWDRLTLARLLG